MWKKFVDKEIVCYTSSPETKCEYSVFSPLTDLELINNFPATWDSDNNRVGYRLDGYGATAFLKKYIVEDCKNILPPGIYRYKESDSVGWFLSTYDIKNNETFLSLGPIDCVIKDYNGFLNSSSIYSSLRMLHKRGILLYGPPGTGKTSTINSIINNIDKNDNTLIIYVNQDLESSFLEVLKKDNRNKIIVIEEITQLTERRTEWLLNFLDGEASLNHCYIIATTNYPEKLPDNLTNRPGRFDKFYNLNYLSKNMIKLYLENKMKKQITQEELSVFDTSTTFAEIKEILLTVLKDNITIEEATKLLYKQKQIVKNDFKSYEKQMGFVKDEE